ncbi:MAG: bacteriohemerythrin [Brevinematia bacterium]
MKKIVFTEDLKTGIERIDNQHIQLIQKINDFLEKLGNSDSKVISSDLEEIFDFMAEYAKFHFSDEEKLMEEHECPILNLQKMQHQFFMLEANKLKFDLTTKGLTQEIMERATKLLIDWISSHISNMDKKIKNCIHKNEQ